MLKRLLLLSLSALLCLNASAQFRYKFKDTTTPYAPLVGATSLNGSLAWDEENLTAPMPFSWKMDSIYTLNKFNLTLGIPGVVVDTSDFGDLTGFLVADADFADRGLMTGISRSPIRYLTAGTAPNRIFKLELAGAGFFEEMTSPTPSNLDSVSFQVWIYETSNIVEIHYGPSNINNDYFFFGGTGPFTGFGRHVDWYGGTGGTIYYLDGSGSTPTIDSFVVPAIPANQLTAWPANGRVFRFSPRGVVCTPPVSSFTATPVNSFTTQFTFTASVTGYDSLVWSWGDGQTLKVTTGLTAPVTHTYTLPGRYNVSVTAYNACGNTTSATSVAAVSVGNISALGNVSVYPNPAVNVLTVEGMAVGSVATITSVTGQVMLRSELHGGKSTLDISALPTGVYALLLEKPSGESGAMRFSKQ